MDILSVQNEPFSDISIECFQYHTYLPYNSAALLYNDEIKIPIQDLEALTLPSNSYIYIEGQILTDKDAVPTKLKFINNAIAYLFREIRYEMNGVTLDSVRNLGLVSTLKNYLSLNDNTSKLLINAGWCPQEKDKILIDTKGNFNVFIPLKLWLGIFEDFNKVVLGSRQELILIREKDDLDAVIASDETENPKIKLSKISWHVPHITPSIPQQLILNKIINSNIELPIKFRSWELIEYPVLPNSTRHTWPVKTTTKLESPRHVIIAFQNNRKGNLLKDMSQFDHCNLRNIRVFLNSNRFPYNDLELDFESNRFATLYEMFANFQESYYHLTSNQPLLTPQEFKTMAPIIYIDASRQPEIIQSGSVTMRIEFETTQPIGTNISAYCLILHEKEFYYNPLTKIVRQV
ncbi:uncharacterized protein LOC126886340 [Diabrotica virgifera virgifera]|uniref:Double jelly roll-like domain-containing protein n=1 Tax=Diabrotica virgifera virgifera TaxID=50390 RepID=A0ABM5KG54_DIAVI|nr:uncharacterized protein LOC126886340 [Diabrotica virgifera virgifera]